MIKDELQSLLLSNAAEKNISKEQSLREIITQLQIICDDLAIDFDSSFDKAILHYEEYLIGECKHPNAFPTRDGSVYCPGCDQVIIKASQWRQ
jgi:hypothetical protein